MTSMAAPTAATEVPRRRGPRGWIRAKDPDYLAVKRSVRAAVVMPAVFGVSHVAFSNVQVDLFTAFGSFALLLLVDFTGRPRVRCASYLVLFAVGCGFIALGTLVSTHKVPAVAAMAVVGFLVLFAGIVAPQAATAATAALLLFVLPVAVAAPPSQIGPTAARLGIGRRRLHPGLHACLAHPVARRPAHPARRGTQGRGPGGGRPRRGPA